VEAPDYDEARASWRAGAGAALRAESKAHAFFVAMLLQLNDPDVRTRLKELRNEEIEHEQLVRRELAKVPPDPQLAADDFADEPVGH
jgi:rubrerythrin